MFTPNQQEQQQQYQQQQDIRIACLINFFTTQPNELQQHALARQMRLIDDSNGMVIYGNDGITVQNGVVQVDNRGGGQQEETSNIQQLQSSSATGISPMMLVSNQTGMNMHLVISPPVLVVSEDNLSSPNLNPESLGIERAPPLQLVLPNIGSGRSTAEPIDCNRSTSQPSCGMNRERIKLESSDDHRAEPGTSTGCETSITTRCKRLRKK